ncbi:thioredoxin reductase [Erysipelatoclostridium sp. An173]|uniref:FAD-dependent oxidoreductase n=1 Tax=Erysipelatoclostridium sp. An173 TaxID=1965571 RepID=UPI000B3959D5|nr:FAD-dependent oxidoreductase [Erysipelatoclostridium sp. An173]OUP77817.1 thioredoxin reductase [Erysipelatoclostridium sp. An173]
MTNNLYDAIIVGGGPAGLSAAIYLARAKFSVLVIEKEKIGGQITITSEVVNYPGILKTSGKELTEQMYQQARNFGAEFLIANVTKLDLKQPVKVINTDKGEFKAAGIVLATGSHPRKIGFPGEKEFQGRGVAYCATCDGEFFTDKDIFVIGGGFAAAEEAVFLTKYGRKVTIIVREDDFTCAKQVSDQAKQHPKIDIHYNSEIVAVNGTNQLQQATFKNNKTGETWQYQAPDNDTFGVFVFAGYQPATSLFQDQVELNETGNLIVDENQKTSCPGVYGAGDVCVKDLRQVVTAVSDGAKAATSLEKYIPTIVQEHNLKPKKIELKNDTSTTNNDNSDVDENNYFISSQIKAQLKPIFDKLERNLILKCYDDGSKLANEMKGFLEEFVTLSDKLSYTVVSSSSIAAISFYDQDDNYLNIAYHGIPGGHEFNSFVIAVYNTAGAKQPLQQDILKQIQSIEKPIDIKVIVSLSCTMCPEVVMATQRIAIENKNVEAQMFDLAHFPNLKEQYNIMSVPCMVINDKDVYFGKKDISQIVEILK